MQCRTVPLSGPLIRLPLSMARVPAACWVTERCWWLHAGVCEVSLSHLQAGAIPVVTTTQLPGNGALHPCRLQVIVVLSAVLQ